MNKLIIGLLLVGAAGAGVYFLITKKKDEPVPSTFKKEWILGQWKTDAVLDKDSTPGLRHFDFRDNGELIRSTSDSTKSDTANYSWNKVNDLILSPRTSAVKMKGIDSVEKNFAVIKLTTDSLQVLSNDSVTILFTRVK